MKLLKKISSAAVIFALVFAGCAGPKVRAPDKEQALPKTLKSPVMTGFIGPLNKIKKKAILAVKGTELLRFEIKGFFNEPVFILVANGRKVRACFIQDNAYFEGEIFGENSDTPASIFINRAGKLILKNNGTDISAAFTARDKNPEIPVLAEFTSADYRLSFIFIDPEINKELSDDLFILLPPKSARRISEDELNRYLGKWNK